MKPQLVSHLKSALQRRASLIARDDLNCYRLVHGTADGIPGFVVEQLADVLVVQLHHDVLELTESEAHEASAMLHDQLGTRAVYRKEFLRDRSQATAGIDERHRDAQPWIGEPVESEVTVREGALRFQIRPYDGFSIGLFLEQRDNRKRVLSAASGRRVLNCFASTCGFSVAAAKGSASTVHSVDVYKRYLEWGKANFELNELDQSPHRFFCSDVLKYFGRAKRQGYSYDLIILDPPTFARLKRPKRVFQLDEQLEALCRGAMELLAQGGEILLCTNHRRIGVKRLARSLTQPDCPRRCVAVDELELALDFAGDSGFSKAVWGRFE